MDSVAPITWQKLHLVSNQRHQSVHAVIQTSDPAALLPLDAYSNDSFLYFCKLIRYADCLAKCISGIEHRLSGCSVLMMRWDWDAGPVFFLFQAPSSAELMMRNWALFSSSVPRRAALAGLTKHNGKFDHFTRYASLCTHWDGSQTLSNGATH